MKYIITAFLLTASVSANAATARWTGQMEYVTTVTYKRAVRCEYEYIGQRFWTVFESSSCPLSVGVR